MLGPDFAEVMAGAARGDEAAFVRLWRDVHTGLVRYLDVLAREVAQDVASETWEQVVRGLGRFAGDERGFRAWVYTIARSKVIDWRRRQGRRPADLVGDMEVLDHAAPQDVAEEALERLSTRWALGLIATLPPEQAEIVLLRVIAGLDVAAVATLVGRSPGAVRVAQHRALRRLARELERSAVSGVTR